ncbi:MULTISPECIES: DUF1993 family protein [unclassified Acidisoma]|uniref:DUF1993 domain-containing protein n=1 Tax=unclassified Acidisoma TaxID=2634065 RepID=UPI0020B142BE|nr:MULTISPECIES: DUF1993 domain-containing protein [unclassified Acidisoma]
MYDVSVPVLLRGLNILSAYLDKAATFAAERNIDPAVLISARLAPDMMSLAGQVQRASDNAKGGISRLTLVKAPSFPDTETSFEELKNRIAKTVLFLQAVKPEQLEGSESRPVEMRTGIVSGTLRGDTYLLSVLIPNFFFHITTTHDILRQNGLKVGKNDYFGALEYL